MKSLVFRILFILILMGSRTQWVYAQEGSSGEYEIDYEEEPDSGESDSSESDGEEAVAEKPAAKTSKKSPKRNAYGGGPAVQGTHSKNRFAPMLKSETRSVYKKNGKPLDVDTD